MTESDFTQNIEKYLDGTQSTELHTVETWTPKSNSEDAGTWIIYIHGGAWRDPMVDSRSFEPVVAMLENSPLKDSISGFASINYRLSPYPTHPESPSKPEDPSRNVHYPDHLLDIGRALSYLDEKYKIDNKYMLVGHSAGATMAFELHNSYFPEKSLPQASCVLGVAGIYNFEKFVENHKEILAYKELMENAFPDKSLWDKASTTSRLPGKALWEMAKQIVISHSEEDELVENEQASLMLDRASVVHNASQRVHGLKASGKHDEIWESGSILAGIIEQCLEWLRSPRPSN
ncbi:Alpha/Beta hydrolase protein [Tricladium varicosporioides]|nr:Alpha/Beta hydrolase protein [Hymenoscyphus varicosporioides]